MTTSLVAVDGYTYGLVAPIGEQFDAGFMPDLTPAEMLRLGVFSGRYFPKTPTDLPCEWFHGAALSEVPDPSLNYFKVEASQPLEVWQQKGWIHPEDPLGWFQWYCRYFLGRRIEDDARQIKRWRAIRRHIAQIKANCQPGDSNCRPRQRQALLHWAYDSRKF
jgi:hypothetical protein